MKIPWRKSDREQEQPAVTGSSADKRATLTEGELATGEVSEEIVYGLTSLKPEHVTAKQLLAWVQSYWGIENGLHYRRDVTLGEDALRMTSKVQAEVMAVLNNFIVGLVRKLGFNNLAAAQRIFDAKLTLALAAYS